uniref:glyoxalase superfamily protein n=1 Tax=Deinococcus sp. TaxID=47478 RepID=UPI0025DAAC75
MSENLIVAHKAAAAQLRATLQRHGLKIGYNHALEVVAALCGLNNWRTLAARPSAERLTGEAAHLAAHRCLNALGYPVTATQARAAATLNPPLAASELLILSGAGTLAPWPLLPVPAQLDEATRAALAEGRSLTWHRGRALTMQGR